MTNVAGQKKTGRLAGLKVIDLSHVMAGPTCAMLLADMGADVIKVEKIPGGDDARRMAPPTIAGESAAFLVMRRAAMLSGSSSACVSSARHHRRSSRRSPHSSAPCRA